MCYVGPCRQLLRKPNNRASPLVTLTMCSKELDEVLENYPSKSVVARAMTAARASIEAAIDRTTRRLERARLS